MNPMLCFAIVFLDILKKSKNDPVSKKNNFPQRMMLSGKKELFFQIHLN